MATMQISIYVLLRFYWYASCEHTCPPLFTLKKKKGLSQNFIKNKLNFNFVKAQADLCLGTIELPFCKFSNCMVFLLF